MTRSFDADAAKKLARDKQEPTTPDPRKDLEAEDQKIDGAYGDITLMLEDFIEASRDEALPVQEQLIKTADVRQAMERLLTHVAQVTSGTSPAPSTTAPSHDSSESSTTSTPSVDSTKKQTASAQTKKLVGKSKRIFETVRDSARVK